MMTKIKVTCKLAKFQPSWLKLPLKGISLGGTVFLVESFLSEQVIYFQVQVYEKKMSGKLSSTFAVILSLRTTFIFVVFLNLWGISICLCPELRKKKKSLHFLVVHR